MLVVVVVAVAVAVSVTMASAASAIDPPQDAPPPKKTTSDPEPSAAQVNVDVPTKVDSHVIVEGQVLNDIGGGEEDVRVTLHRVDDAGEPGALIHETTTDEMGDFKLVAPEPIHGEVIVTFTREQRNVVVRRLHVGDSEWPEYLAEQLEGNLTLTGRVISTTTQAAVAGAVVTVKSSFKEWALKTDDDGSFDITGLLPGRLQLVVEASKFGRENVTVDDVEDADDLTIALKPERVVHLRVVDETAAPVRGAVIELLDAVRDDFRTTVTDKDGRATIGGLHYDAMRLTIRMTHPDYVSSRAAGEEIVTPLDEPESKHDLTMHRAGVVRGTILDAATDRPLYGVRIMTGSQYSDSSPRDWTDTEGKFEIRGIAPGKVVLTAHLAGYAPELLVAETVAAATSNVEMKMSSGTLIEGTVVDVNGDPMSQVVVEARAWRDCDTIGLRAMTATDGSFRIEDAPLDEFSLVAYGSGGARVSVKVNPREGRRVELKLPAIKDRGANVARLNTGDAAPGFQATTTSGKPIKLDALRGKFVLLDFWATWCGPCVQELPHLIAVHKKYGARKNFVMLGVSLDFDEKVLAKMVQDRGLTWDQVVGDDAQKIADSYGVQGIPALFIVAPDGKIAARYIQGKELDATLSDLLKNKADGR